jgi:hypothetical protein
MTAFERFAFPAPVRGAYPPVTVSFLVIAHNDAPVLPAVLKSVWREARATGGEVILADDGSTDGSDRICAAFAHSHPGVRYRRQPPLGFAATLDIIAGQARGAWVRLCEGRTPLLPGSTEALLAAATKTGASIALGGAAPYPAGSLMRQISAPGAFSSKVDAGLCRENATKRGTRAFFRLDGGGRSAGDFVRHRIRLYRDATAHLLRLAEFRPATALIRQPLVEAALPPPSRLILRPDIAVLFSAARRASLTRIDAPVCLVPQRRSGRMSAADTLGLQQIIRVVQDHERHLTPRQKRLALFQAARRANNWLNTAGTGGNNVGRRFWLRAAAWFGRLGLLDFAAAMDRIALIHEAELGAVLNLGRWPLDGVEALGTDRGADDAAAGQTPPREGIQPIALALRTPAHMANEAGEWSGKDDGALSPRLPAWASREPSHDGSAVPAG